MKQFYKHLLVAFLVAALAGQPVLAQGTRQDELIDRGMTAYEVDSFCDPTETPGSGPSGSKRQERHARTIIGVVKALGMTKKAALIAFMTVKQESGFTNLGNSLSEPLKTYAETNPNYEGVRPWGGDHDSVGLFQQRPSSGWSTQGTSITKETVWEIMGSTKSDQAAAYTAMAFLGLPGSVKLKDDVKNPGALRKGLINKVPNYNDSSVQPGVAAQTVQVSAFPDAYNKWEKFAQGLVSKYWNSSPAIALPIPTGIIGNPGGGAGECDPGEGGTGVQAILNKIRAYAHPKYSNYMPDIRQALKKYRDDLRGQYQGDCRGVDCGAFVALVMRKSGADPKYAACFTGCQITYLEKATREGKYVKVRPPDRQPGDIGINDGHVHFYIGDSLKKYGFEHILASASQCGRVPMSSPDYDAGTFTWYRLKQPGGETDGATE